MNETMTLELLATRLSSLEERLEDLEDLAELNAAIARNGDKPATPWSTVKAELENADEK